MAKEMIVSVALRKPVTDTAKGTKFIEEVRALMATYEDVIITGHCVLQLEDPPAPPT